MKQNLPDLPFAAILQRAAKKAPEGRASQALKRVKDASEFEFLLCDISSSMLEPAAGGKQKFNLLEEALEGLKNSSLRVVYFSSSCREGTLDRVPYPGGGTALHLALAYAGKFRPKRTVIISDGHPDNQNLALQEADSMTGTIDVLYCGPETDTEGIAFLQALTTRTGGRTVTCDLVKQSSLAAPLTKLLAPPQIQKGN